MKLWFKLLLLVFYQILAGTALSAPRYFIGTGGLTIHGDGVDRDVAKFMPNRIDSGGYYVLHPKEFSLLYKNPYHYVQGDITLLKDCFNRWAAFAGWGGVLDLWGGFDAGFIAGFYYRHELVFHDAEARKTYTIIQGPEPWVKWKENEIIPMGFVTLSYTVPMFVKNSYMTLALASNWYLSHFQIGFSW